MQHGTWHQAVDVLLIIVNLSVIILGFYYECYSYFEENEEIRYVCLQLVDSGSAKLTGLLRSPIERYGSVKRNEELIFDKTTIEVNDIETSGVKEMKLQKHQPDSKDQSSKVADFDDLDVFT